MKHVVYKEFPVFPGSLQNAEALKPGSNTTGRNKKDRA